MCTDSQHKEKIDLLTRLVGMPPLDRTYQISSTMPYILDYQERKHIYLWSTSDLLLSLEELGTLSISAGSWVDLSLSAGMRIYAVGQTTLVPVFIRCVDEAIDVGQPVPSNLDNILLINANNVSTTQNSPDQTNPNGRGVKVWFNITTLGANLTLNIQYKDPVSGQYVTALASAAINSTGFTQYTIYPGITGANNVSLSDTLPRTWRVQVTGASGSTFTVSASVMI